MYRALKNFILRGKRVKVGDKIKLNGSDANRLIENGCVYESKEDKRVYDRTTKANKEHTGAGWYLIKKGNQVIDKVRGKEEAQELVDEINGN